MLQKDVDLSYTKMNYDVALKKAQIAALEIKTQIPYIKVVAITGSIRRKQSTIDNISILVVTPNGQIPAEFAIYLNSLELKVIKSSAFKILAIDLENCMYQFDFCEKSVFPCYFNYLTGTEEYIIGLRKVAKDKGYKLTKTGFYKRNTNELIPIVSEEMIYDILCIPYDDPTNRMYFRY